MTSTETVPRTANLLACRQWWKVCFLYGDQEKYYRQIYGKAASQRLAQSQRVIYPTKTSEPVVINDDIFPFVVRREEKTVPNSKVTVLDDPFLFGFDNESDSGIEAKPDPPKPILKHRSMSSPSSPLIKINNNRRTGICDVSGIVENAIGTRTCSEKFSSVQFNIKPSSQLQVNRTSRNLE